VGCDGGRVTWREERVAVEVGLRLGSVMWEIADFVGPEA